MDQIKLTAQDLVILRKMTRNPGLDTSTHSHGWQPWRSDVPAVNSMMERGILEKRPGFDSIQLTDAGLRAVQEEQERIEERFANEGW